MNTAIKNLAKIQAKKNVRSYATVARVAGDGRVEYTDGYLYVELAAGTTALPAGTYDLRLLKANTAAHVAVQVPRTEFIHAYFDKAEAWQPRQFREKWIFDVKSPDCVLALGPDLTLSREGVSAVMLARALTVLGPSVEVTHIEKDSVYLFRSPVGRAVVCGVVECK